MEQWIKGMDLSTLPEVEALGGRFFDGGIQGDAVKILKSYGMNLVRLRLWNNPRDESGRPYGAGTCDLSFITEMASRLKNQRLDYLLDFQYSDFWADPGKQIPPKAWRNFTADELERAVYDFTLSTMEMLKNRGLLPAIAAIGNEITNGLLWPHGKTPNFPQIARFVGAGIRAVRETAPETSIMLHLDNGGNNALYRNWFDRYFAAGGLDFDYIGLSYYPFWHGTPGDLERNLNDLAFRYQKDLIVAEISTAFTLTDYQKYEKLPDDRRKGMATKPELARKVPYEMSPSGQAAFLKDIMQIIRDVPDGRGKGFIYWEPAWLPVPGSEWAAPEAISYMNEKGPGGNEWANQALFDYDGNALPALAIIRDF